MLLKPVRWISFDVDHTLWNPDPALVLANKTLFNELESINPTDTPFTLDAWEAHRAIELAAKPNIQVSELRLRIIERILTQWGITDESTESLYEAWLAIRQQVEYYEDTHETLDALVQKYPLIAITNGNACMQATGAHRWFRHWVAADAIGYAKPHPAPFEKALELTNVKPSDILHVGDHPVDDVQGAQKMGMQTAWVNRFGKTWEYPEEPTLEVSTLHELLAHL